MGESGFESKIEKLVYKNDSLLCIGLDTEFDKLPFALKMKDDTGMFEFNKAIINETHAMVCAYKLNSAFYEAEGAKGIAQLKQTCDYLKTTYPEIPVILDAKKGDIPHTNEAYVKFAYDYLGVDAITLHPYLGKESLKPFLEIGDRGCFILCKNSNPGAGELQDLITGGVPLYQKIAIKVSQEWNSNGNCMLVVGATYPDDLAEVRKLVGDMIILTPGVGAQAGDLEKIVKAGINSKRQGLIINASRSIIYASQDSNFFIKSREAADALKNQINAYRNNEQPAQQKNQTSKENEL